LKTVLLFIFRRDSMLNIEYDIVGSFLRPESVKTARARYAAGESTLEDLRKAEDEAIAELVKEEVAHGLKFPVRSFCNSYQY